MYSLHLNYYLLTISVTNTSKCIDVRQTVRHSHGKLKGKKHKTQPTSLFASFLFIIMIRSQDWEACRLGSAQRMQTWVSFHITGDYGNECWQIACQTLLMGLLGSCIWPAVILSMIITSLSQRSKTQHFLWESWNRDSWSTISIPWAFSMTLTIPLKLKFKGQ